MTQNSSDWINSFFATCCRDLTPAAVHHTTHVLYAPVSKDPGVTGYCASVLSENELQRAERFVKSGDKSLFIQRRAFRRFCGALAFGSSRPISQIVFKENENGRPHLSDLPDFWFSFSSFRLGFLGAWSSMYGIGVDIEDRTRDPGAVELAQKFFSAAEARVVAGHVGPASLQAFTRFWTLKEAALKSIGQGLPFGLDAFEFELDPDPRVVHTPPGYGGPERYSAHMIEGTESCAAVVIRSLP
jgi:phosphopantetheinyl transferase